MVRNEFRLSKEFSDALLRAGKVAANSIEEFFAVWGLLCDSVAREINAQFARQPHVTSSDEEKPKQD